MQLPNFFIVGAAKAGTTSLWRYLIQHPEIFMPSDIMYKEPAYFSDIKGIRSLHQYAALFSSSSTKKMIGEASTAYLTSPESPVRIKDMIPDAKIIIMLRNPIDRAYSLYNWMACNGYESATSFELALKTEKTTRYGNEAFKNFNPEYYYNYLYYHSGLYSEQIKRYLDNFNKEQICFVIFEKFKASVKQEVSRVFAFLGVDDSIVPEFKIHNSGSTPYSAPLQFFIRQELHRYLRPPYDNAHPLCNQIIAKLMELNTQSEKPQQMSESIRNILREGYIQDVHRTSELIDEDLSLLWTEFRKHNSMVSPPSSLIKYDSIGGQIENKGPCRGADTKPAVESKVGLLDQTVSFQDLIEGEEQTSEPELLNRLSGNEKGAAPINQKQNSNLDLKQKSPKIIHLCSHDFGGAGKAAYRLHKGLQQIGIASTMLVLVKKSEDPSVKVFPSKYLGALMQCLNVPTFYSPIWKRQVLRWQTQLAKYKNRPVGLEMFTDSLSDIKLEEIQEIRDADIINLHWVGGVLDYHNAPLALRDKQVVWTLHDMNPFTGGCHYSGDCEKYKENCGACPQLGSTVEDDLSRQNWKLKYCAFANIDLSIVTPSKWLANCVSQSSLLSQKPAKIIPNGFPLHIFKPYSKKEIRNALNIPESAKVILFGADSIVNTRKGFAYLLEALKRLSNNKVYDTVVLTFGILPEGLKIATEHKIYNFGSITDENKLALVYSAADVFIIPSLEDNLPNTVVEAMACGVPVVGFEIGGIPDMIEHKKNGFLARSKDVASLLEGIKWALSLHDRGINISAFCRERAERKFALEVQANAYKKLYDSLISNNSLKSSRIYTKQRKLENNSQQNSQSADLLYSKAHEITDEGRRDSPENYLVSAIVSTYNAERFIRGCIEDLEGQTIADKLEIIIVNSGSKQNEDEIIKEFQTKFPNIKYIKTSPRETVYAAWNRGIKAASGKYITNANTDDRHRKDAFEVMANTLEAHSKIVLVYADLIITETENECFESCTPVGFFKWLDFNREDLLNKGCFMGPQPMWRREVHEEYGYFDPSFVSSGDYEFWLRISQTNKFLHLPIQLGLYLRSPLSIEHSNRERQKEENHTILNMYKNAQASGKIIKRLLASSSKNQFEKRSGNVKFPESIYRNITAGMENKQPQEVIIELEKSDQIKSIEPELKSPEEMYQEIQSLLSNGDPHKAIAALEKLLERFPEFAAAQNDLGVLFYHTGDKEKAQRRYERAVELMPDNINFQKNLADYYCVEMGRIEDALQIYVNILKTDPQDIETLLATGQICKALGRFDDARDFFNQVLEIEPWNADARSQIEEITVQPPRTSLNSESSEDAYRRLQEKLKTLIPVQAIVELEKLVKCHPDCAEGHNDLGMLYYNSGNKEKSLHHYQMAADLKPENMTMQKNLADFLFVALGKIEEALKIYLGILELHPDDVETLLITGHICVAIKKLEEAKGFYERVISIEPDNEDAAKNLRAVTKLQIERLSGKPGAPNDAAVSSVQVESADRNTAESEDRDVQNKPTASIVISLDGIQNRIKQCIQSIASHTAEPYELILIDNGSLAKGIQKWAQNLIKDNAKYQLVKCDKTFNLAQCLNQAVKAAAGGYIVLMHNDVMVVDGWLSGMHQFFQRGSGIGVVGPMTNETVGIQKIYFSDYLDPNRLESVAKAFYEQNQYRRIIAIQLASFCLMFRHELIDKIGNFDTRLVSEQAVVMDFCKRSAAWGFQNLVAGDVFVYHADRHKDNQKKVSTAQLPAEDQKRFKENWNKTSGDQFPLKSIKMMTLLETVNELHQKGYQDQAVEMLLNAIGALPEEKRLYLALAKISISLRRYQDALDTLNEMPSDSKTETGSEGSGNFYQAGLLSPALVVSENHELEKMEILGYAEEGLENFAAAEAYADRMLSIDPKSARALNLKGILAFRKKDLSAAEQFFEKAIASDPGAGEPYSNLAALKQAAGKEKEVMKLYERGFILSPTDFDIATNYHAFISEFGDYKRAEKVADQSAALYPKNRKLAYMLIDFLLQQGRYDEAMIKIEAAIVKFGIEDGLLAAALQVRKKMGPTMIEPSKKRVTVSCCMIIKDEEKYLARCLASVKPIVDEMIVVDTGSSDLSKDIATAFGAQVYDFEWQNDFAKARNFSLEKASGDWILIMDGDEVISPLDYKQFKQIVKSRPKAPIAYTIVTRNYSALANIVGWVPNDGKYVKEEAAAGWIPSIKTRLFYGRGQIWFEGAVHELVDPIVKRKGFKSKQCCIPVHHYGRLDKERLTRKGEVYFEIGEKKLEEMGDDINAVRELAIQATTLEKNEMAIKLWQRLISLNPPELMVADAYINMATLYNRLSDFDQALLVAKKAIAVAPHIKESLYNYALAELHLGNAQATIKVLEELVNRMPDYPPAQFILFAAYFCSGEKEKGFKIIRKLKATALGSNLVYPIMELAETLIKAQQNEYALLLLGAAIECDIVNKQILELFNKCIQLRETNNNLPEHLRPLPLDRPVLNFENLPQ
ncbi:MAG: glycosyltransferase [Desulfobacterales bacterium]